MATPPGLDSVLVIGGCGFLGHHIVKQLLAEKPAVAVSVMDLRVDRNTLPGVKYYPGDLTSADKVGQILQLARPRVVIHTASPVASAAVPDAVFERVNVGGTANLLQCAAAAPGVVAFVYTSSASVAHGGPGVDVVGLDERSPVVMGAAQPEFYSHTKAVAEVAVLDANRSARPDFLTCSIRPAGIFGEGDVQMIPGLLTAYYAGNARFQIGNGRNRFDFTYVGNIATAHILAARALLATARLPVRPLDHEKVDGEAFFITNGDPWPWWDFAWAVWARAGNTTPRSSVWVLPRALMLVIATIAEWMYLLIFWGKRSPNLKRVNVKYSTMTRWYSIDKAKRRLAYEPQVDVQEGINRAVDWNLEQRKQQAAKKAQ